MKKKNNRKFILKKEKIINKNKIKKNKGGVSHERDYTRIP